MTRTAALILAAFLAATPAIAAPAAPPANGAEFNVRLAAFTREIVGFAQPHNEAVLRAQNLMLAMIDGAGKAMEPGDKAQMRAWSREWVSQARAEQRALKALQPALPTDAGPIFDRMGMGEADPRVAMLRRAYAKLPESTGRLIGAVDAMADEILPQIDGAIEGEPEAVVALGFAVLDGTIVMLQAENAMVDVQIAGAPNNPQTALSRSAKASNEAAIALFDLLRTELLGETPDPAQAAAIVRARAAEARAAALEAPKLAAARQAEIDGTPLTPEMRAKLKAIYGSFDASSRTEAEIAAILSHAADRLEEGGDVAETVEAEMANFESLVDRRVAEQQERVRLLGQ